MKLHVGLFFMALSLILSAYAWLFGHLRAVNTRWLHESDPFVGSIFAGHAAGHRHRSAVAEAC
jgi:hypothetical protein